MILVDREIIKLSEKGYLISKGFDRKNINSISYDLTLDEFADDPEKKSMEIVPGEFLIIKTKEELRIPNDISGRIGEKNSLIRLGLKVDGPQYQPGHNTYAFLRVQNISRNIIVLNKGMKVAQIYFEKLTGEPDVPYSRQQEASFQNEYKYRGFGNYEVEYKNNIKSFEKVKEDIENVSHRIYGNVLTLMGILVAIFSMITINYQAFTNASLSPQYIIVMNLSLAFCIVVMLGMVLILVNGWKKRKFPLVYGIIIVILGVAVVSSAFWAG